MLISIALVVSCRRRREPWRRADFAARCEISMGGGDAILGNAVVDILDEWRLVHPVACSASVENLLGGVWAMETIFRHRLEARRGVVRRRCIFERQQANTVGNS